MDSRDTIIKLLENLQKKIIASFEDLERGSIFSFTSWKHSEQGGGRMAQLRGKVFEKAAVNFSAVGGKQFPMQDGSGAYFATGVSLITHMQNPHAPTVHFNVRYIKTEKKAWFGGGFDLTPMGFPYEEDTKHFHKVAKEMLDKIDPHFYPLFSKEAATYFYIPHRKKERGIGGIFFDHLDVNVDKHQQLWLASQEVFLEAILPIYQRRIDMPYGLEDKEKQQSFRAHYVEFNLLYDRGTKFGFLSGGNPEAILCSMPPCAKW